MTATTHYDVLGVDPDAGAAEIRSAYRSLARRYHPDAARGDKAAAEVKFTACAQAYAVLSDAAKRRKYDKVLTQSDFCYLYGYEDAKGDLLFTVHRSPPKTFEVIDSHGKKIRGYGKFPHVPYRLCELLAADPAKPVFVVEGEKDVERMRQNGFVATCNAFGGGKGKWTRGHSRWLRGRHVVVIPDFDSTGEEHAAGVAKSLRRVAASVKVVRLENVPHKGDVSDWFDRGGTAEQLVTLAEAEPAWKPGAEPWRITFGMGWKLRKDESAADDYTDLKEAAHGRRSIFQLNLNATEKLLMILLGEYQNPPLAQLAGCLKLTTRRLRQILRKLVARGLVTERKSGRHVIRSTSHRAHDTPR